MPPSLIEEKMRDWREQRAQGTLTLASHSTHLWGAETLFFEKWEIKREKKQSPEILPRENQVSDSSAPRPRPQLPQPAGRSEVRGRLGLGTLSSVTLPLSTEQIPFIPTNYLPELIIYQGRPPCHSSPSLALPFAWGPPLPSQSHLSHGKHSYITALFP